MTRQHSDGSGGSALPFTMSPIAHLSDTCDPKVFYETYVKPRRPVVISGGCWTAFPKMMAWTPKGLKTLVGSEMVEVNQVNSTPDKSVLASFSPQHCDIKSVPFDEFIDTLQGSNDQSKRMMYMTTQPLGTDDEGRPSLFSAPVTQLVAAEEVDLKPLLLGNLVPMSYNLWIGRSTEGSSSGLHHDFHDNLYCLLQGAKTFRLAPPESVKQVTMKGTITILHPNGRIVYQEQIEEGGGRSIRPDGATEDVEQMVRLDVKRERLEEQLLTAQGSDAEQIEEELERVQEEILDFEMAGDDCCDEEHDDESSSATEEDDESGSRKRRKTEVPAGEGNVDLPVNFCLDDGDKVEFETVELHKGDLLYLPAGWFHEVTSRGSKDSNGLHMAFNYWMHPPDVGDGVDFENPYRSEFWPRDWKAREL